MMWVRVGKTTHKHCVSGPLFACRVSPRHALSGKISQHRRVGPTCWRHVGDMSATFPAKLFKGEIANGDGNGCLDNQWMIYEDDVNSMQ